MNTAKPNQSYDSRYQYHIKKSYLRGTSVFDDNNMQYNLYLVGIVLDEFLYSYSLSMNLK